MTAAARRISRARPARNLPAREFQLTRFDNDEVMVHVGYLPAARILGPR